MSAARLHLRTIVALLAPAVAGAQQVQVAPHRTIPDQYIVVFHDSVANPAATARRMTAAQGTTPRYVYTAALKGFAAHMSAQAAAALARDPAVRMVEQDQVMHIVGSPRPARAAVTWGLDRIDQRALPLDGAYNYTADGTGVTAYIIDTGIRFDHVDFGGRAQAGIDEITSGGNAADCNGHGTHVAGTVGGSTYGVAKKVSLVAVRVLDCSGSGSSSGVIAGIDWVTQNKRLPAVANMSLGGGLVSSLNQAVANSTAAGVTYAVAAGNSTADACQSSPASEPSAITVGATDQSDVFASFSNYGSCVDLNAPGVSITSDYYSSTTSTATMSGTSMATPHVAGAAAVYLSTNSSASPAQVSSALTGNATSGAITSLPGGTPNLLLYTGFIGAPAPAPAPAPSPSPTPTDNPPVASFTKSCSGFTCTFTSTSTDDNGIASYAWTFGDGSASVSGATLNAVSHTYKRGNYTATLKVTDTAGQASSATTSVSCNPKGCK